MRKRKKKKKNKVEGKEGGRRRGRRGLRCFLQGIFCDFYLPVSFLKGGGKREIRESMKNHEMIRRFNEERRGLRKKETLSKSPLPCLFYFSSILKKFYGKKILLLFFFIS